MHSNVHLGSKHCSHHLKQEIRANIDTAINGKAQLLPASEQRINIDKFYRENFAIHSLLNALLHV